MNRSQNQNYYKVPRHLDKVALLTALLAFMSYPQAVAQTFDGNRASSTLVLPGANNLSPVDSTKLIVPAGSGKGFMALLRDMGITNEKILLAAGTALQAALENNFPEYNGIIKPGTQLIYVQKPLKVINVLLPNGGIIVVTLTGTDSKPQTQTRVEQAPQGTEISQAKTQPMTYAFTNKTPAARNTTTGLEPEPLMARGTPVKIGPTGVVGALRQAILKDYHEIPSESVANQAGTFIDSDLKTLLGNEILPGNLTMKVIRDNTIGGMRVYISQTKRVKTNQYKMVSGKKVRTYAAREEQIAEYIIVTEGTTVTTTQASE